MAIRIKGIYADKKGIMFLSTPFDYDAVEELESLGIEAYKIATFEMVDLPFLSYIAKKQSLLFYLRVWQT